MDATAAARAEVAKCIATIKTKLGHDVVVTRVEWSDKMSRTWGRASLKTFNGQRQYIIVLASKIFTTDSPALRNTVAHEVAHLADFQIYNQWGHGRTWRYLMSSVLGCRADRCVTEEEKSSLNIVTTKRLVTKYEYVCPCSSHLVGGARHKKATSSMVINKKSGLYCTKCHAPVVFTGKTKKA